MNQNQNVTTSQYLLKSMTNSILAAIQACGFDIQSNEKQYKIQFNTSLFTRPNQKAFEVIVHFLLTQIDPERADKQFSQCWPVVLKEQQKEFKDVILNWLSELTTQHQNKSNLNTNKPTQFNHLQQMPQYQSVLQSVKFPFISKALLMNPGGIKICELLYALSHYALFITLIRLVENCKLNIIIFPKMSPFYNTSNDNNFKQPFTQAQSNSVTTSQSSSVSNSSAKLINPKQLLNYDIQTNFYKRKIDFELNELIDFISKLIPIRSNWQNNLSTKTSAIRCLMDKKISLTQSLLKKKSLLAKKIFQNETFQHADENNIALEDLYNQFKEEKLNEFERNWLKFSKLNSDVFENEFNKENIDSIINSNTIDSSSNVSKLELNGNCFTNYFSNSDSADSESNPNLNVENKVLKFVYQHIDSNSTIRNTDIGQLFHDNGSKLDLTSLIRLYNMILMLNGQMINKIDKQKLDVFIKSLNISNDSDLSFQKNQIFNLLNENKHINEDCLRSKKKLDAYLSKLIDKLNNTIENALSDKSLPLSPERDKISKQAKQLIENYYNLDKSIIDQKLYAQFKEEMRLKSNLNKNEINNEKINCDDETNSTLENKNLDLSNEKNENQSLEILDLENSMELI